MTALQRLSESCSVKSKKNDESWEFDIVEQFYKELAEVQKMNKGRENPDYPLVHCFTLTKCEKCGEWFEADPPMWRGQDWTHVCKKRNSYPDEEMRYDK